MLADLSRSAWESLKVFIQDAVPETDPIPGAVIAIQSFGDFLGFNPHCHILVTDGCFYGNGMFRVAPPLELKKLEAIFQHKVFKILLKKGKITKEMIAMLSTWRHSGFHVFCGNRISPDDETAMENLARFIIRASFSLPRPGMAGQPVFPHPHGASRWCVITATTVTSHGENGRRTAATRLSPASSNPRGMKRSSGGTGRVLFKRSMRQIP